MGLCSLAFPGQRQEEELAPAWQVSRVGEPPGRFGPQAGGAAGVKEAARLPSSASGAPVMSRAEPPGEGTAQGRPWV